MRRAALLWACLSLAGCSGPQPLPVDAEAPGPTPVVERTPIGDLPEIDAAAILAHARVLSSDEFDGRAPGTRGESLTVRYLVDQFQKLGLKPGNTNGTFVQRVPLVGIKTEPSALVFKHAAERLELTEPNDVVAVTRREADTVSLSDSDVVFVGYGVVAPEYDWDDYKGLDVRGKTVVMLVNDPPVPDPSNPDELDPRTFGGRAMTYYGRWTYKFETASEKGAVGAFIIHETDAAGYAFDVVKSSWSGEQSNLAATDGDAPRVDVEGWLELDAAKRLLALAGQDFDVLKAQAATREFSPVPLGATASMTLRTARRRLESQNVLARIDGSDPKLKSEYVVYMAHWDHLGESEAIEGDGIYNGAVDNAVGVAGLLELARAFTRLSKPPRRSILFFAPTAEEQGLLGSESYVRAPLYPLEKTAAVINIETLNVHGRTRDLTLIGLGASDLDDYVREAAGEQGRIVRADPEPEKGFYYRSDHFSFAKKGVPTLDPDKGVDYLGKPEEFGLSLRKQYVEGIYHKPSDVVQPEWDLTGACEDLKVLFAAGYRVADSDTLPQWKPKSEFRPATTLTR